VAEKIDKPCNVMLNKMNPVDPTGGARHKRLLFTISIGGSSIGDRFWDEDFKTESKP
jgi:hypothetical protein